MNITELRNRLADKEFVELQTMDGKEIEICGGRWCFLLAVDGVTIKNTKTLPPIFKKLNEFELV